jgi:5-methylcytosine-specific restriction endonuclease McrA
MAEAIGTAFAIKEWAYRLVGSRHFYATHHEAVLERERIRRALCPNVQREYKRTHPEQCRASCKKWRSSPAGKLYDAKKAAERRASGHIDRRVMRDIQRDAHGVCPYCLGPIEHGSVDHIVPIADGGTNDPANLLWCCLACNRAKSSKSLLQFLIPLHEHIGCWQK